MTVAVSKRERRNSGEVDNSANHTDGQMVNLEVRTEPFQGDKSFLRRELVYTNLHYHVVAASTVIALITVFEAAVLRIAAGVSGFWGGGNNTRLVSLASLLTLRLLVKATLLATRMLALFIW
jgi:hypothetical protein